MRIGIERVVVWLLLGLEEEELLLKLLEEVMVHYCRGIKDWGFGIPGS